MSSGVIITPQAMGASIAQRTFQNFCLIQCFLPLSHLHLQCLSIALLVEIHPTEFFFQRGDFRKNGVEFNIGYQLGEAISIGQR
ncbi:MAG: hypothetical protein CM15mP83_3290 [Flavobacteriaceae bacterium]|nr:MAG: hypothetical protein CM15mP83_3290 [Flavobacteriaceae bacterium]